MCNVGRSYVALPLLLGFPLSTLPYPLLLFSPFPRLTGLLSQEPFELVPRGLDLCLRYYPHVSDLNWFLYTFRPRTFYAQRQWTWQGFLLVFVLLFSYIILFIFVFICLLLLYLHVALFWFILFDVPPCTQDFPNLIARTFVVAGLSVASVCKSPGVYWFVSVDFHWILPGVLMKQQARNQIWTNSSDRSKKRLRNT
jgi:hypothetical protein